MPTAAFDARTTTGALGERQRAVLSLSRAIERRAVDVVYQPIVALATGETVAAETLVRWSDPGVGGDVGTTVINAACRQAGQWTTSDWCGDLTVHVNVAPLEMADAAYVSRVANALAAAGIDPARLVLEMTEGMLESASAAQTLHTLRALGVGIAVDHFGAGFGVLSRLRGLIDYLKIDAAVVHGIGSAGPDRAIARSVFSACAALGITSIADGVATREQGDELRQLGCDLGQGSAWSLPLASTRFGLWLARQRRLHSQATRLRQSA